MQIFKKVSVNHYKKVVITGGPGSGKSTLINLLEQYGYFCFKEFSRSLIQKSKNEGEENYFKSKPIEFSRIIWKKRIKQLVEASEIELKKDKPFVFFDRGIHDIIAYMDFIGQPYGQNEFKPENYTYEIAILLPPWKEIYTNDLERLESFEEAHGLHHQIKKTYELYNIPIVEIPFGTAEDRILNILEIVKDGK